MNKIGNLYSGWVKTNIHYVLEDSPDIVASHAFVLITCIDSLRNLKISTIVKRICRDAKRHARILDKSLVLLGTEIPSLVNEYGLFTGFDELWCFPHEPAITKPQNISIVGPRSVSEEISLDLEKWMSESGCVLGLGDGEGLNYVTTYSDIALLIEQLPRW